MSLLLQDMQEPCLSNVKKVHFETLLLLSQECFSIGRYKPNSAPEAILREPKNKSNILKGAIRCPTSINPRYVLHLFSFRHNRWIHTCKNSGNFNETFFRALSTLKKLIRQVYCLINECNNTAAIHDPHDNGTSHITKNLSSPQTSELQRTVLQLFSPASEPRNEAEYFSNSNGRCKIHSTPYATEQ